MKSRDLPSATVGYRRLPWPPIRNLVVDFVGAARAVPTMNGLFEIDVTLVKHKLAERAAEGRPLSLTAYLAFCLSRALEEHPTLHGLRRGKEIIVFDDVDINTLLEKQKPDGSLVPVMYIVRAANKKSLDEIDQELKYANSRDLLDEAGVKRRAKLLRFPAWVRRGMLSWAMRDPFLMKKHWGTVGLSNVGSNIGARFSLGTSFSIVTMTAIAGSIATKVMWLDGQAVPRQVMGVTLMIDHNLIDGAPASRFAETFAQLMERATGL
jgi:pyruvate/2-oxoglutarate dehydrogenase complex dihydrolipoamide acyltransferase (E2) component